MLNETSVYKTFELAEKNAHLMEESKEAEEEGRGLEPDVIKEKLARV